MSASCDRAWEVEAERDGRLDDAARTSAARHRAHCRVCREELAALQALTKQLTAEAPPALDVLAEKRLRGKLLAAVNERRLAPPRPRGRVAIALALAAAVVLALGAWKGRRGPAAPAPAAIALTDEGGAMYERVSRDGVEHVYLRAGSLGLVVHHEAPTHLLVHVPDGEIEDLGTTFHVTVRDGTTVRVRVDEGRVLIRKKPGDRDGTVVAAGETWEPPKVSAEGPAPNAPDPGQATPVAAEPPAASLAAAKTPPPAGLPASAPAPRPRIAAPPGAPAASAASSTSSPGPSASAAKPALPPDEDAAYMRVVSLLRAGRRDEARAAARRYVVLFPSGLRRREMDVVAE